MRKLKRILAMGLAAAMLITAPGFRSMSFAAEADTYEKIEETVTTDDADSIDREDTEDTDDVTDADDATLTDDANDTDDATVTDAEEEFSVDYMVVGNNALTLGEEQFVYIKLGSGNAEEAADTGAFVVTDTETEEEFIVEGEAVSEDEIVVKFTPENSGSYSFTAFGDDENTVYFGVDTAALVEADAWLTEESTPGDASEVINEDTVETDDNAGDYVDDSDDNADDEAGKEEIGISDDMTLSLPEGIDNVGTNNGKIVIALNAERDDTRTDKAYDAGIVKTYNGSRIAENVINGKVQQFLFEYLSEYNCEVYKVPRYSLYDYGDKTSYQMRVDYAVGKAADVFVTFGLDDSADTTVTGAYIIIQNANLKPDFNTIGKGLATQILARLTALGLTSRGTIIRSSEDDKYSDGSAEDWYGYLRRPKLCNLPAIMIKHAYLSNASDYQKYLSSDDKLRALAKADAEGIIAYYKLVKKSEVPVEDNPAVNICNGVDYSPVYNYEYYIAKNPDLKSAFGTGSKADREKAIRHFVLYGMNEVRRASADFDPLSYIYAYPDLRNAYQTNWSRYYTHYLTWGKNEGRVATGVTSRVGSVTVFEGVNYSAVFNVDYYLEKNPDVKAALGTNNDIGILRHFVLFGMNEGRSSKASFELKSYAYAHADLRRAFGNDYKKYYMHYLNYGKKEGRIAKGITAMAHPVTVKDGVDYSCIYDCNYYITYSKDVMRAYRFRDDLILEHFINYGMKECRRASENFNVYAYANRYSDLQKMYGTSFYKYYIHFLKFGYKEGRNGKGDDTEYKPIPFDISEAERQVWTYLRSEGYSDYAIAGIIGCMYCESNIQSDIIEAEFVKDFPDRATIIADLDAYCKDYLFPYYENRGIAISRNGYLNSTDSKYYPGLGLIQWTGPRAYNLLHYNMSTNTVSASYINSEWNRIEVQLSFFIRYENSYRVSFWKAYKAIAPLDEETDQECVERATEEFFSTIMLPGNHSDTFLIPRKSYAVKAFNKIQ